MGDFFGNLLGVGGGGSEIKKNPRGMGGGSYIFRHPWWGSEFSF